jgi:hypothetical protein
MTGGGDEAEDVAGAIGQFSKLSTNKYNFYCVCVFFMGDSPTHGKQYHDISSDTLIDKIPTNHLED